jgi:hypothetical protein
LIIRSLMAIKIWPIYSGHPRRPLIS